jgi:hypothetical protein
MKSKLRKTIPLVLILSILTLHPSAQASSPTITKLQAQKAINGLKTEIAKTKLEIANSKAGQEKLINTAASDAQAEISKIQLVYQDKMKIQLDKKNIAKIRLTEVSNFKVLVDNISACGPNFQTHCDKNQTIAIPPTSSVDVGFLIRIGGFIPLDEAGYASALKSIVDIDAEILRLDSYLPGDKSSVEAAYKNKVALIYRQFDPILGDLDQKLLELQKSQPAALRSFNSGGNYLDAFKTAMIFNINLQSITEVANTSFANINSLLDLSVVRNAVTYAENGNSINLKYSNSKAIAFNRIFGNTFLDAEQKDLVAKTTILYKKFAK